MKCFLIALQRIVACTVIFLNFSFDTLIRCHFVGMQRALCNPGPDLVVCDEGHRIKNHQSNIHHALHKIKTRFVTSSVLYV